MSRLKHATRSLLRLPAVETLHANATKFLKRQVFKMPTVGVFAALFDEQGRILLVQQNYRQGRWALPGGRLELGESVTDAIVREIREETGYLARVEHLVGVYSMPKRDDLILFFEATIEGRGPWAPGLEIGDVRFFSEQEIPEIMEYVGNFDRVRIEHAFARKREVIHVF